MKHIMIYVHGKGGSAAEAEHYKALFPEAEVLGFDYRAQTPWEAKAEFPQFFEKQRKQCDRLTLAANSIGAFFSMSSLDETLIDRAYFISPVVDMKNLIENIMLCTGVSERELEMPFEPWSERVLAETLEISERGIQVMLAHVERYFRFQRTDMWQRLSDRGIYMQTNANALLRMASAGKTLRMLRCGMIQFLASDCHNLKMRPPRMQEAARKLSKHFGDDFTADFFRREEQLLWEGCAWYA